jgi:selenocysteine lyase/cysteine desulfurase
VDERTLFVATSHVFFSTGFVQDLETLADIARASGAMTLIDGYQGAGQVKLDLPSSGVDFYTSGPLKWLCGGPGLAYLYVSDRWVTSLEPRLTSWFAHRRQFDFDTRSFEYREDARRFEMGTPALPTVYTALGGQEVIDEVGMDAVVARNRELTLHLVDAAVDAGLGVRVSPDLRSRSAIVTIPHEDPPAAVRHLARHGIIVDHRPGYVRVSPHFYNTKDEVGRCVEVLAAFGTKS